MVYVHIINCPLWWDRLSSHLVTVQVHMKFTHMVNVLLVFHLGNNIGIVPWTQGIS